MILGILAPAMLKHWIFLIQAPAHHWSAPESVHCLPRCLTFPRRRFTFSRACILACIIFIALTCADIHKKFCRQIPQQKITCLACISVITPLSFAFRFSRTVHLPKNRMQNSFKSDSRQRNETENHEIWPLLLHLVSQALLTVPKLQCSSTNSLWIAWFIIGVI